MEFRLRDVRWAKRRIPTKEIQPVSIEVPDIKLEQDYTCDMYALYDDGNWYKLAARVNQNDITGKWTVQGINHFGLSAMADII